MMTKTIDTWERTVAAMDLEFETVVPCTTHIEGPFTLAEPRVLALCVSPGGIPKYPQATVSATKAGLERDGRNHSKHIRPDRAVSIWDHEILQQLVQEGFSTLVPGAAGENLTVVGLNVQSLPPGTLLRLGDVVLRLQQPRKPCYVLDAIDPRLKDAIVGRCGYMASVVEEGTLRPGMTIEVILPSAADPSPPSRQSAPPLQALPGERAYLQWTGPVIG